MASYIVTLGLLTIAAAVAVPTLIFPASTLRYIRRKRYQYEVTFGLYMLTPREKFVLGRCIRMTWTETLMLMLHRLSALPHRVSHFPGLRPIFAQPYPYCILKGNVLLLWP